tara:strand:+ start:6148 stop:7407 length:1260 start_codon:yes stop_codon:yes gene_type:complete
MNSKKKIGIIGLGYVGLPLYLLISKKYETFGFDLNEEKIDLLKKNKSYISDISNNELKRLKKQNILSMDKIKSISKCDYIIFCLPTPLKNNAPDMTFIISAFNRMFKHLKQNQTIILESTVFTGATSEIFVKKLNKKFKIGRNFYLGYSPERIDPGKDAINQKLEYKNITKLVSGYSEKCKTKIIDLYKSIFSNIYPCKSIEVAETAKIFENIFRAVNIAVVNEMKMITNKLKLNIHDVVDAAASKPFGFRKFVPGPGVGGHCIPVDPIFMSWLAKRKKQETKFINLSTVINHNVTSWTLKKINQTLPKKRKLKCLLLGIAYKKDINDYRESPSLKIFEKLKLKKNFSIEVCDTYIKSFKIKNKIYATRKVNNFKKYDCVILLTDHSNFNYKKILNESKLIFDTRGVFKNERKNKIIHL